MQAFSRLFVHLFNQRKGSPQFVRTPLVVFNKAKFQLTFTATLGMRAMATAAMAVRMISGTMYMPL